MSQKCDQCQKEVKRPKRKVFCGISCKIKFHNEHRSDTEVSDTKVSGDTSLSNDTSVSGMAVLDEMAPVTKKVKKALLEKREHGKTARSWV